MSDDAAGHGPVYRVPRHNGMDPATRRLAIIAAGLGGALFVVIGAWSMLGSGGGEVPVISPPAGPVKVKPENPGGLKITNSLATFGSGATDADGDKLAPAPESPDPQALMPPPAPPSVASAPVPLTGSVIPAPPPLAVQPSAPQAAARAKVDAEQQAPAAQPQPAQPPAAAHHPDRPAAAAAGGRQVQLAALSSREQAEAEWRLIARKAGRLLDGHSPEFSQAVVNGRTWWRLRTGGFADEAAARAFCDQLRASGTACSVARF